MKLFIAPLALCTLLLLSFSLNAQTVAIIGSKKITLKEFNRKYNSVKQSVNPPSREQFLEDLIRYEIGLQEARKKKLQQDPLVIERMEQELYKALIEKDLTQRIQNIKITESELKKYYRVNPEIRTSHILIELRPDANRKQVAAAKKRANEIYNEVRKSKRPFEKLVALYSDDSLSKRNGGDIGWQTRLTLVPRYYETALKMKKGRISRPIETQFGFHIVKLTGRRTYEDANKRNIRAAIFEIKRKKIFDQYFANLKKKYSLKVNKKTIR